MAAGRPVFSRPHRHDSRSLKHRVLSPLLCFLPILSSSMFPFTLGSKRAPPSPPTLCALATRRSWAVSSVPGFSAAVIPGSILIHPFRTYPSTQQSRELSSPQTDRSMLPAAPYLFHENTAASQFSPASPHLFSSSLKSTVSH